MSLAVGQTLSQYEILAKIGQGGMGEVWRARDTRLGREVAIKVLPAEVASDPARLERFEREARTLASLNHPNVAGIHGIDEALGTRFLAMELVPGEDLAQRLERGPLPIDEAIDVCRQIAEGLEAAHEAGVVHRDLKPANVRLTREGVAKVLDFGLAKPMRSDAPEDGASALKTDTFLVTSEGMVLGTPAYMSPEQARGKPVDRRADIWAWGCVLFECLTGRRGFEGDSFGELMAAILERPPPLDRLPAATPPHVRRLLERALTKDPRTRLRDIGEARVALTDPGETAPPRPRRSRAVAAFTAGVAAASLVWVSLRVWSPATTAAVRPRGSALRVTIDEPPDAREPVISPNGDRLLYAAGGSLWLRDLAESEPRAIPGTEGVTPAGGRWSPDGDSIAFLRDGFLEILRLGESRAVRRCPVPVQVSSFSWADDGGFLMELGGKSEGLLYLAPEADAPQPLDWIEPEKVRTPHRFNPFFLPGGDEFLITDSSGEEPWIHLASLTSRSSRPLVRGSTRAEYVEPGWLAWVDAGRLLVQPFDRATSTVAGSPRELARGVESFASTGEASFSFSTDALVYQPMERSAEIEWVDRQGRVLGPAAEPRPYAQVRLDRTGGWMVAAVMTPEDGYRDLWLVDLERGAPQRFTDRPGWEDSPAWSPDGRTIAFAADWTGPPNLYLQGVGGGEVTELVPFDQSVQRAGSWTADGRSVVYSRNSGRDGTGADLWIVDVGSRDRRPLLASPHQESEPELSPDGRWIAYTSDESGRSEIYVASFPSLAGRRRVSAEGGSRARWARSSSELYYLTRARAIATAAVREREGLPDPGPETVVIQASEDVNQFEVSPDASRFLVLRRTEDQIRPVSHLIVGWERLLEARGR